MAYCRSPEWEELWHAVAGWWTSCCNFVDSNGEDFPPVGWHGRRITICRLLPQLAPHIERWAFIDLAEAIEMWNPKVYGERPKPTPIPLIVERIMRLRHAVDEIRTLAVVDGLQPDATKLPPSPACPIAVVGLQIVVDEQAFEVEPFFAKWIQRLIEARESGETISGATLTEIAGRGKKVSREFVKYKRQIPPLEDLIGSRNGHGGGFFISR